MPQFLEPCRPLLQSAFGGALKGVQQVGAQDTSATLASVDAHLDMLRPAISNYGGSIVVRQKHPNPESAVPHDHQAQHAMINACSEQLHIACSQGQ